MERKHVDDLEQRWTHFVWALLYPSYVSKCDYGNLNLDSFREATEYNYFCALSSMVVMICMSFMVLVIA